MVQPERPQTITLGTRFTCWINKAISTHSEYVILIALPMQQWLRERAPLLRYTYIAPLVGLSTGKGSRKKPGMLKLN